MNREEATQWLERIKKKYIHGGDEEFDARRKEALDMAIQALEQEPCEDAISGERVAYILGYHAGDEDGVMKAYQKIKELPPVQPMRKRGKWTETVCREDRPCYNCSECGRRDFHVFKSNFCPNCGADMREDGE